MPVVQGDVQRVHVGVDLNDIRVYGQAVPGPDLLPLRNLLLGHTVNKIGKVHITASFRLYPFLHRTDVGLYNFYLLGVEARLPGDTLFRAALGLFSLGRGVLLPLVGTFPCASFQGL